MFLKNAYFGCVNFGTVLSVGYRRFGRS